MNDRRHRLRELIADLISAHDRKDGEVRAACLSSILEMFSEIGSELDEANDWIDWYLHRHDQARKVLTATRAHRAPGGAS